MDFKLITIPDVAIIQTAVFEDKCGWCMESFKELRFDGSFLALGLSLPKLLMHENHSCSNKGVPRGLHFQLPPHPQGMLVRVSRGSGCDSRRH